MLYFYGKPGWTLNRLILDFCNLYTIAVSGGLAPAKKDIIINWGRMHPPNNTMLNQSMLDKYTQLQRLDHCGVSVPTYYDSQYNFKSLLKKNYPILGRNFHHSRGRDIKLISSYSTMRPANFYTKFIPKVREYRVHILAYKGTLHGAYVTEKVPYTNDSIIWNNKNSKFINMLDKNSFRQFGVPSGLTDLAYQAMKAVNLDFGAVDIIEDKEGGLYVLEINTAPRLMDYRRKHYIDYFYTVAYLLGKKGEYK